MKKKRSLIQHITRASTSLTVRKVIEKDYFSQETRRNNLRCSEALHVGWFDNMVKEFLLFLNYSVDSNLQHKTFTWPINSKSPSTNNEKENSCSTRESLQTLNENASFVKKVEARRQRQMEQVNCSSGFMKVHILISYKGETQWVERKTIFLPTRLITLVLL